MNNSIGTGSTDRFIESMGNLQQANIAELSAEKNTAKESFMTKLEEMINPFAKIKASFKSLKEQAKRITKLLKKGDKSEHLDSMKFRKQKGDEYQQKNPELKSKSLVALRERIKPEDTVEEILEKVMGSYPDVTLADEALDYLLETSEGDLHLHIREAKEQLYKTSEREIIAGRNISELARETEGIGTPTTLRDLYRNMTGSPKEAPSLFEELSRLYPFNQLKKVFRFLFHSLGNDFKSKGPSIPRGQLHVLAQQTKALQSILGIYRFFAGRTKLIQKMFLKEGEKVPPKVTFENLSKKFMLICSERYPTSNKILEHIEDLGINTTIGKIIILQQVRDALDQVSPDQIFRSQDHKLELKKVILDTLEDLEDEWEELMAEAEEPEESISLEEK